MPRIIKNNLIACIVLLVITAYAMHKDKQYKKLTLGALIGLLGSTLIIYGSMYSYLG